MKTRLFPRLFGFCALLLLPAARLPAADSVAAIIARARACLGPESALNAVTSIRYTGTLVVSDEPGAPRAIEIIFEKPARERVTLTAPKLITSTVLDGYDAWQLEREPGPNGRWRKTLMGIDEIRSLRANAWENLNFYRGISAADGSVRDAGPATLDGRPCDELIYTHEGGYVFKRYFDPATGKLLLTETAQGTIREEGEMMVDGIRFPKKVINQTGGKTVTITFDRITLNEVFPESLFAYSLDAPP